MFCGKWVSSERVMVVDWIQSQMNDGGSYVKVELAEDHCEDCVG